MDNKSTKHKLFYSTLFLHQKIAGHFGGEVVFLPKNYFEGKVVTARMAYDEVSQSQSKEYKEQYDYIRYRTMELLAEEISRNKIAGDIAEAGVDYGDFSWIINGAFPDRTIFYYDTFEGFDDRDVKIEKDFNFTSNSFLSETNFKRDGFKSPYDQIDFVRSRLKHQEHAIFRKGYFPESAEKEKNRTFAFVSLDMDLYQPIKNGIQFFWPRLSPGGYMMIHDYNHREFQGIKKAVQECEEIFGKIPKLPIPDQGGTVVLTKV